MDGLALFCNLCADGPVTLRRLRASGVRELADLERVEPATLALWLHASLPQARAFAAEARKLARRIAVPDPQAEARPAARTGASGAQAGVPLRSVPAAREVRLAPGLLPALDEALCARLAAHGIRTTRALAENAGLDLARKSGVAYSTLLGLARAARRHAEAPAEVERTSPLRASEPVRELVPFRVTPRAAERQPEPPEAPLADAFTLPTLEPESAGPFG